MCNAIAGQNKPATGLACQSDGAVRALDSFNTAEENKRRILGHLRLESEEVGGHKVWDCRPMRAPGPTHSGDVLTAPGKLHRAAAKLAGDANLLTTSAPLIGHQLWNLAGKQRQQVHQPSEAM